MDEVTYLHERWFYIDSIINNILCIWSLSPIPGAGLLKSWAFPEWWGYLLLFESKGKHLNGPFHYAVVKCLKLVPGKWDGQGNEMVNHSA